MASLQQEKDALKQEKEGLAQKVKELEENFRQSQEWKQVMDKGGILSVPVEEFRVQKLPHPVTK